MGGILQSSARVNTIYHRCNVVFFNFNDRYAPTIDLVLLSHGDLSHSGLYPYAYSRWQLKAPAYTTLPVQAMARIAATEDVEGLRDEEEIGDEGKIELEQGEQPMDVDEREHVDSAPATDTAPKRRYVTTGREVHDAFDSVNTLRYSQPTHLQGSYPSFIH